MSSKKDLVEAHSFNRRRLITAFVSGAPGGREVEPVRYGRTLVGGLVLALLIVAGAAVAPLLKTGAAQGLEPEGPRGRQGERVPVRRVPGHALPRHQHHVGPADPRRRGQVRRELRPRRRDRQAEAGSDHRHRRGPGPAAEHRQPRADRLERVHQRGPGRPGGAVRQAPVTAARRARSWPRLRTGGTQVVAGRHQYAVPAGERGNPYLRALGLDGEAARPPSQACGSTWSRRASTLEPFSVEGAGEPVDTGVDGLDQVGSPVRVDGRPYVAQPGRSAPVERLRLHDLPLVRHRREHPREEGGERADRPRSAPSTTRPGRPTPTTGRRAT